MPIDKDDYCWRMLNEHMTQARHQETLRSTMSTLLVSFSSAIIILITLDKSISFNDLPASILIILLGLYGMLLSAKHYERFHFHIARVRGYRKEIEDNIPEVNWEKLRKDADDYHAKKFSHLINRRQNTLWLSLHGIIIMVGLVLTYIIIY